MEEDWRVPFSFTPCRQPRKCTCFLGEVTAAGFTLKKMQVGGRNLILWATFCWKTLGLGSHVDVNLTHILFYSNGILQWQRYSNWGTWLRFQRLSWLPNPPDHKVWSKSDLQCQDLNTQNYKSLSGIFRGLVKSMLQGSELLWQHVEDQHPIMQMVIMFWLIWPYQCYYFYLKTLDRIKHYKNPNNNEEMPSNWHFLPRPKLFLT